jgi:hypothetical protein
MIEAISVKRKMYFEYENAPYHCLDVEVSKPTARGGQTGLAGGDHLHFTMLVNGQMVNPIEWWDEHWIQDRILRKLQ